MSATSHFVYDFKGCAAAPIPCDSDGTIFRLPLPKGMPHRKVYFGIPQFGNLYYMNYRTFLIFRNCGEEVLRLPYHCDDEYTGGNVHMFCPDLAVNGGFIYPKATRDSIQCGWRGVQYCVPGFELDILADQVQWWYDREFSPVLTISDGVILLAVFSEEPYVRN